MRWMSLVCAVSLMSLGGGVWAPMATAQDVPVPGSKTAIFKAADEQIKSTTQRQATLRQNLEKVDDEIEGLRRSMVKVAREVKKREGEMSALEDRIDELQTRRTALQKKLQKDHRDIGQMAAAMLRLRTVPPEVLLARPGAPLETAQAAMILRGVVEPLQTHAQGLYRDLAELAQLEKDLTERQETLKSASRKILAEQTKMAELIRRRESAYASLQGDLATQESELKRLAQDAADFRDLIKRLEQRNRDIAAAAIVPPRPTIENKGGRATGVGMAPPVLSELDRKALRALGDVQMPISGIIRIGYGALDDLGSKSQGLRIEGRAGALVVAPMNGVVRYRGRFKNYGNMVIIEHAKNYHSLVAGLAKIDTVVGQSVMAGEPVGQLGPTRSSRPSIYYELRQNGKPVNPSRIFADLG